MGSTGCVYPSREYVLHAILLSLPAASQRPEHEAGGVKNVVRSGTVAVAM